MKKLAVLIIVLAAFALTGCSGDDKGSSGSSQEVPKMIEVEIMLPEKIMPNEEVEIKTHVTQDGEDVEDANKVEFEITKANGKDDEMIVAKHVGDGVYAIRKTFTEEGTYRVTSHVTARDMHNMPNKEFVVGKPSPEDESTESEHDTDHDSSGDHDGH